MATIKKLLLALDIGTESELLIRRVSQLYSHETDNLYVVHVVKQGLHDLQEECADLYCNSQAQRISDHLTIKIRELFRRQGLTISSDHIVLAHGEPACEIKKLAKQLSVDLVFVGSHCKDNDWLSLPGATTNCVIQGISSDVMAIKV